MKPPSFSPCENPCEDCPTLGRLHMRSVGVAARANTIAAALSPFEEASAAAERAAMRASALLAVEGPMGEELLDGFESRGAHVPTFSEAGTSQQRVEMLRDELEGYLEELDDTQAEMNTAAERCSGPRRYGLGPLVVCRCTSSAVPLHQRFGVSDL